MPSGSSSINDCEKCPVGKHSSVSINETVNCIACSSGQFQLKKGMTFCLPCTPGKFQSTSGASKCHKCMKNTYSNTAKKRDTCRKCPTGWSSEEGSAKCRLCEAGKYSDVVGQDCKICGVGQYRTSEMSEATKCRLCEPGLYQNGEGQASCLPCIPGEYNDQKNQKKCKLCDVNEYTNTTKQTSCKSCGVGEKSEQGSAKCTKCDAGEAGTGDGGVCESCPIGFFRHGTDLDATQCKLCELGEETTVKGSSSCSKCEVGQYGNVPGTCMRCPDNQFQDGKGESECKKCESAKPYPNEKRTACEKPDWITPEQCNYVSQYFDGSDGVKKGVCRPCPHGANCTGSAVLWSDVNAKEGYWRLHVAENRSKPPDCILNAPNVSTNHQPTCAFERCFQPDSCIVENFTETCDEKNGYKKFCVDRSDNSTTRCRLCATCKAGFKRTRSGAKCQQCPSEVENRVWLVVGFLVLIVGTSILIFIEITEETSQDETSDAVKKIILNFLQIVSLAGGLPLQWPTAVNTMFESFDTISSAGTTLLIPDCELSNLDAAEAFYTKQWVYTFLLPIVIFICVATWSVIRCFCKRIRHINDYMILSIVMLTFLLYPTLVKLCLSVGSPGASWIFFRYLQLTFFLFIFPLNSFFLCTGIVLVRVSFRRFLFPINFTLADASLSANRQRTVSHGVPPRTMF